MRAVPKECELSKHRKGGRAWEGAGSKPPPNMTINLSSCTGSRHLGWPPPLAAGSLPKFTLIDWSLATGCQRGGQPDMSTLYAVMQGKERAYAFALSIGLSQLARCDERGFSALASQSIEERARPLSSKQHMLKIPLPFEEAHEWRAFGLI